MAPERISTEARPLPYIAIALALLLLLAPASARAQAPIEDELILQTPVSTFIVDAALRAFSTYARERWGVALKTKAH